MKKLIKQTIAIFFVIFIIIAFTLMVFRIVTPTVFWYSAAICAIIGFFLPRIK